MTDTYSVDGDRLMLGEQFKKEREIQGLTFLELSDMTWISEEMLRKIEKGDKDAPLRTLHVYASALGVLIPETM